MARWILVVFFVLQVETGWSFPVGRIVHPRRTVPHPGEARTAGPLFVAEVEDDTATDNDGGFGGLMLQNDAKSQLFASFSALSLGDQYDAVLTGLCAKIVDDTTSGKDASESLQDPIQLLQEMNSKRIVAAPRSMMALIDVSKRQETMDSL